MFRLQMIAENFTRMWELTCAWFIFLLIELSKHRMYILIAYLCNANDFVVQKKWSMLYQLQSLPDPLQQNTFSEFTKLKFYVNCRRIFIFIHVKHKHFSSVPVSSPFCLGLRLQNTNALQVKSFSDTLFCRFARPFRLSVFTFAVFDFVTILWLSINIGNW